MKRRNDLPQITKHRYIVGSISKIISIESIWGSATGWVLLLRKERFEATDLFNIDDSPTMKGGRTYFLTEPHRLSVTFKRTRPSDTLVNSVNIWLWQCMTLNAKVKTSAIYARLITGSFQKKQLILNTISILSFKLQIKLQHVCFQSANIRSYNLLAVFTIHNIEWIIYERWFICGREDSLIKYLSTYCG